MDDLISRQAAYEVLTVYYHHATDVQHVALHDALSKVPSAERHGRWIELYKNNYKCSVCGSWWTCEETPIESSMYYCPVCGARMDSNAIQHTACVGNALDALDEVKE